MSLNSSLTPEEREALLHRFLTESPTSPGGTSSDLLTATAIPWFNPDQFKDGVDFVEKHLFSFVASSTLGALYLPTVRPATASLIYSGTFSTPYNCYMRIINTSTWVLDMIRRDMSRESSPAVKTISSARKSHKLFAEPNRSTLAKMPETYNAETLLFTDLVRKDMRDLESSPYSRVPDWELELGWEAPVLFSQYTVFMTLMYAAFPIILYPESVGLGEDIQRDPGFRGFIHVNAILARMLGTEDAYNLFLTPDFTLYQELAGATLIPSWKMVDERSIALFQRTAQGMQTHLFWNFKVLSVTTVFYILLRSMAKKSKAKGLWDILTWAERFQVHFLFTLMWILRRSKFVRIVMNWFTELVALIVRFIYRREKGKKRLRNQRVACPF